MKKYLDRKGAPMAINHVKSVLW
jgi:serine/threonine protein kinase